MRLAKPLPIIICLLLILGVVQGCAREQRFVPDFSTPETAFRTTFFAVKNKMYGVVLDSMSNDYRRNFGPDQQTQQETLKLSGRKIKYSPDWERKIIKVEYGPFEDGSDARVIYDEYQGGKPVFLSASMPMVKEDGQWKIALLKPQSATAEEIAATQKRTREMIETEYVLDEEQNAWVPAKKQTT